VEICIVFADFGLLTAYLRYTFTDLAAGGDLFSLLMRQACLEEFEVRWLVKQIVSAISYLHAKGIVHRDLKLENILLMGPNIAHRIVVSDFGCAGLASRGRMKSKVGTLEYQAP